MRVGLWALSSSIAVLLAGCDGTLDQNAIDDESLAVTGAATGSSAGSENGSGGGCDLNGKAELDTAYANAWRELTCRGVPHNNVQASCDITSDAVIKYMSTRVPNGWSCWREHHLGSSTQTAADGQADHWIVVCGAIGSATANQYVYDYWGDSSSAPSTGSPRSWLKFSWYYQGLDKTDSVIARDCSGRVIGTPFAGSDPFALVPALPTLVSVTPNSTIVGKQNVEVDLTLTGVDFHGNSLLTGQHFIGPVMVISDSSANAHGIGYYSNVGNGRASPVMTPYILLAGFETQHAQTLQMYIPGQCTAASHPSSVQVIAPPDPCAYTPYPQYVCVATSGIYRDSCASIYDSCHACTAVWPYSTYCQWVPHP